MFDKILANLESLLGNADALAAQFGMPVEKVQPIVESLSGKLGQGGNQLQVLMEVAEEHGVPVDKLKEIFQNSAKDDHENPVEDLAAMLARGLFGPKG